MVGSGHRNDVDLLVLKCLADVLDAIRIVLVTAVDELFATFEKAGVGVHEVRNLHVFHTTERSHVGGSAALDATHRDVYAFVRADDLARRLGPANGEGPERR